MNLKRYEMSGKEHRYALINMPMPCQAFDLTEEIDEAAMLWAVREAVKYHPLFGTRIVFENGLFWYEENPEPPIVFRADNAPAVYGTEANNNYPWMTVIKGKCVRFYMVHALTDGMGRFEFIKTVLHLYFERRGVVFADTVTDFPQFTPEEMIENPTEKYADHESIPLGVPHFAPPVQISPSLLQDTANKPWNLVIPQSEIRRFSKESETSTFSVISCILARAMAKVYGITSGNITVRVPVNYRSFFPTGTDRNFAQGFSLMYKSERMNSMSDAMVETAFRSQLDILLDKGNLVRTLKDDLAQIKRLKSGPEEIKKFLSFRVPNDPRANILYTHMTRLGYSDELTGLIEDLHMEAYDIQKDFVSVYGMTFNSQISLNIFQCSKDNCYIDALREVLDGRGISYTLSEFDMEPERVCRKTTELVKDI